jgi:N-carbamoylputrescine amidase
MKLAIFDGAAALGPGDADWSNLCRQMDNAGADIVVTNEMPFGERLASSEQFDAKRAENSIRLHDEGLDPSAISTLVSCFRHAPFARIENLPTKRLLSVPANTGSCIKSITFHKSPGSKSWFETKRTGFEVSRMEDLGVGVLLCTEIMFNERARELGRAGARAGFAPGPATAGCDIGVQRLTIAIVASTVSGLLDHDQRYRATVPAIAGEPYRDASGCTYLPMFRQPVLVFEDGL